MTPRNWRDLVILVLLGISLAIAEAGRTLDAIIIGVVLLFVLAVLLFIRRLSR